MSGAALYMARCDECEEYAKVEDVVVSGDDLHPAAVALSCGHEMALSWEDEDG